MLSRLTIKNYAIISELEMEIDSGMNIITGETGAGKSILLGALGLVLGERADTKVLYNADEKCVVEAQFDISKYTLKPFFEVNDLDAEPHTIVRREIAQNGKSRAFINDTPVTLTVLKQLGEALVNLHNQHETLELTQAGLQLEVVDTLCDNGERLAAYTSLYRTYQKQKKELEDFVALNAKAQAEKDYIRFQLEELSEAALQAGEQIALEEEQKALSHVEEIKRSLDIAISLLTNSEVNISDQLNEVQQALKPVKGLQASLQSFSERIQTIQEDLKDLAREMEHVQDATGLDPERLEEVNSRLTTLYRLQKKHQAATVEELIELQQQLEQKLGLIENSHTQLEQLEKSIAQNDKQLRKRAEELHTARASVLERFQKNVSQLLAKVGMPNALFAVEVNRLDTLTEKGFTDVQFLFSANKGFAAQPIKNVASGGELSRLMLCIKSLLAESNAMPTMVFDEIDSGISGEVALKTGEIMRDLSRRHQIICITHLPQIARVADRHFHIYKETLNGKTITRMKVLAREERVTEIAKMLSGEAPTEAALANARELVTGN